MFKKLRKLAAKPLLGFSLSLTLLLFSCQDSYYKEVQNNFSGKELFNGVFFGEGPVIDVIPTLKSGASARDILGADDPQFHQVLAIQDLLMTTIEKNDSHFFNQFKSGVTSGDHILIKETMIEAGKKFGKALETISGMNQDELNSTSKMLITKYNLKSTNDEDSEQSLKTALKSLTVKSDGAEGGKQVACLDIVLVIVVLVVLALSMAYAFIDVVAAVVVVVGVEVAVEMGASRKGSPQGGLYFDQLINDMAINLK